MAPLLYHDAPTGTPITAFVAAVLRWRNTRRQFIGGSNECDTVRECVRVCMCVRSEFAWRMASPPSLRMHTHPHLPHPTPVAAVRPQASIA